MVDVGGKDGDRAARAWRARSCGCRRRPPPRWRAATRPKGDVIGTARIAGIQAAKRTAELIPLCHPLPLSFVDVRLEVGDDRGRDVEAEARTTGQTGVEMEAMTAAAVAALTVYDMVKGLERGVEIAEVVLVEKTGGKHDWRRAGVRAAVLTVSSSLARGEGEDVLGRRARGAVRGRRARGGARDGLGRPRGDRRARSRGWPTPEDVRFVFTTGGTGLTAGRRDARGHPRRDRARGARLRRGDPRRLARAHAARHPHPRRVGRPRPHADRELPGQPEGDRPVLAGGGADARARGGHARAG